MSFDLLRRPILTKTNYIIILSGVALTLIGFILMSGGASEDPNVFNEEVFSTTRITVAPILVMLGYGVVMFGIMMRSKRKTDGDN